MNFAAIVLGAVLITTAAIYFAVRHRRRTRQLVITEAKNYLVSARRLAQSTDYPKRRRAGTNVSNVHFLSRKHGLSLSEIGTSKNELRKLLHIACTKPKRESPINIPAMVIDSGLPWNDTNGYSGKMDVPIIPVGENMFSLEEPPPATKPIVKALISEKRLKKLCSSASTDDPRKNIAAVRRELQQELDQTGVTEEDIEREMETAFFGLK